MAGANQHLTYTDKNLVNVIDISYLRIRVSHPNGTEALITKVAGDSKFIVGFDELKCFLMSQDLMDVKITGIGKQINGLYYFDSMEGNLFKNSVDSFNNTKLNWHKRLGHPSDQAKQTREPFPLSEHKSTSLGELVHLDLWGPYRVVSKEGHSPTIDQFEGDLRHPQGSNGSASENEMVATFGDETTLYEDGDVGKIVWQNVF
ncbi:hypothetical protein Tco_1503452 [Tanacetum coccineum]